MMVYGTIDESIEFNDYQEQATTSLSSFQQALDTWNTTIDLSAGWNMFGYGCPISIDVVEVYLIIQILLSLQRIMALHICLNMALMV